MKTENMTFSEAFEVMKQGYKVRKRVWSEERYISYIEISNHLSNEKGRRFNVVNLRDLIIDDWEIYNEPKSEPKFEPGELVMMRDSDNDIWKPKHFGRIRNDFDNICYECMNGFVRNQCAKFDKDIVFTNKPAKL